MTDVPPSSPPSSYLRYLPAIFTRQDAPFLGNYLKVFEKLLTGVADNPLNGRKGIQELLAAEVIGNLFYPRFSFLFPGNTTDFIPPIAGPNQTQILARFNSYIGVEPPADPLAGHGAGSVSPADWQSAFILWLSGFLAWLAGWIDLVPTGGWSLDKTRMVIAQMPALYRLRGTPQGMSFLINLLLDLPMSIPGVVISNGDNQPGTGLVTVTVSNPKPAGIQLTDQMTRGLTFVLADRVDTTTPLLGGYAPWLFDVQVILPSAANPDFVPYAAGISQVATLWQQLRQLLDTARPASSHYRLTLHPSVQLRAYPPWDNQPAVLGQTTLLGS